MQDITLEIPVIDAARRDDPSECRRAADALAEVGCFAYRGTSVDAVTPKLTDMLVSYARQPEEAKARDSRPECNFQVGWTPSFTETARPRPDKMALLTPEQYPTPFEGADPKERFMGPAGARAVTKEFAETLSAEPVIPSGFPEWDGLVKAWGSQSIDVMMTTARMAAIGFGLDPDAFVSLLTGGAHLFAPTFSDLSKYGAPGTALAAWHDDLNFMSVHGKSNYAGLRVWKRNGDPVWVKVPDGCMLVQAGQQFEHLTGGAVIAGLHEVVSNERMQAGIEAAKLAGLVPWRISTTMFGHVAPDNILQPLGRFATADAVSKYAPIKAGDQVLRELRLIGLAV